MEKQGILAGPRQLTKQATEALDQVFSVGVRARSELRAAGRKRQPSDALIDHLSDAAFGVS